MVASGTLEELRKQVAKTFPNFPASAWKNAFYYECKHPSASRPIRTPLHEDGSKPRGGSVPRVLRDGILSAYRRPPPGLDVRTITLDRKAFRTSKCAMEIRRLLRVHFAACQTATDVLHVVALAAQREVTMAQLPLSYPRIIQAFFRSRTRVSDQRVCSALRVIIKRLLMAGVHVPLELYACGLKFSARSRKLEKIRWFLTQFRKEDLQMSRNLFRSVIAKCGIGFRGFGEIRNGKWARGDLWQILFGFDGAETEAERHAHLEAWLERTEWNEISAWLQILVVAGARSKVREEWEIWKRSPKRCEEVLWHTPRHSTPPTLKMRGDHCFIQTMIRFCDIETAWSTLR